MQIPFDLKRYAALLCVLYLLLPVVTGCSRDRGIEEESSSETACFSILRAGTINQDTNNEDRVNTVRMIVFRTGTGQAVYNDLLRFSGTGGVVSASGVKSEKSGAVELRTGTYDFYFVANENACGAGFVSALKDVSLPEHFAQTSQLNAVFDQYAGTTASKGFLMTAAYRGVQVTAGGTAAAPVSFDSYANGSVVALERVVAKIEIEVPDAAQAAKITGIKLYNAAKKVRIIKQESNNTTEDVAVKDFTVKDGKWIMYVPETLFPTLKPASWDKTAPGLINYMEIITAAHTYKVPIASNAPISGGSGGAYMAFVKDATKQPNFDVKRNTHYRYSFKLKSDDGVEVLAEVLPWTLVDMEASIYQYELITPTVFYLYARNVRPTDIENSVGTLEITSSYPGEMALSVDASLADKIEVGSVQRVDKKFTWKIKPKAGFKYGEFGEYNGKYGRIKGYLTLSVQNMIKKVPVEIVPWLEVSPVTFNEAQIYSVLTVHPESKHELLYKSAHQPVNRLSITPTTGSELLNPGMATSIEILSQPKSKLAYPYLNNFLFNGDLTCQLTPIEGTVPDWYWCAGYAVQNPGGNSLNPMGTGCPALSIDGGRWRMPSDREVQLIMQAARILGRSTEFNGPFRMYWDMVGGPFNDPALTFVSREYRGDPGKSTIRLFKQSQCKKGGASQTEADMVRPDADWYGTEDSYAGVHGVGTLRVRPVRDHIQH